MIRRTRRTISDLEKYIPNMRSVSIVPSGLTKFRDGLYPLELFEKEDACAVIDIIEKGRSIFFARKIWDTLLYMQVMNGIF